MFTHLVCFILRLLFLKLTSLSPFRHQRSTENTKYDCSVMDPIYKISNKDAWQQMLYICKWSEVGGQYHEAYMSYKHCCGFKYLYAMCLSENELNTQLHFIYPNTIIFVTSVLYSSNYFLLIAWRKSSLLTSFTHTHIDCSIEVDLRIVC